MRQFAFRIGGNVWYNGMEERYGMGTVVEQRNVGLLENFYLVKFDKGGTYVVAESALCPD
jgi:hypothetical protein